MVKVQKPIPKTLGNKPKLDSPIKNKKQLPNDKSRTTVKNSKSKLLVSIKEEENVANTKRGVLKQNQDVQKPKKGMKCPLAPEKLDEEPKGIKKFKQVGVKDAVSDNSQMVVEKSADKGKIIAPIKGPAPAKVAVTTKNAPIAPKVIVLTKVAVVPAWVAASVKNSAKSERSAKSVVSAKDDTQKNVKNYVPAPKNPTTSQKLDPVPITKPQPPTKAATKTKKDKNKKNKATAEVAKEPKVDKKIIKLQEKKKAKIAFKKAKLNTRNKKKAQKEKKETVAENSIRYEPIPYEEDKFNAVVNVENIKKIAEALKTQVEKEVANKKSSIFEDYRYFLQVECFKIGNCPKRMVKLHLKHSLVDKDDDVLLIVPDLQRGAKVDYEPTIHHFEDMLRTNGVEGIKVMPMNQLRKEFSTFEQKRRLFASYEHFLCDGRIVSHVVGIVGKIAQKPRHTIHAVRLNEEKDIKAEIEKSLRKTAYRQLAKGSTHSIPVGTHKFTSQQLAENIEYIVEQLKKLFPGGLGNVRNLYLKIDITGTSSLPLYISMAQAPEVTPMVVGPREQRMIKLKREANEVLTKFAMTKEGKLIKLTKPEVKKKRVLQEMKAALKEDEEMLKKEAKKSKKSTTADEEKKVDVPEDEEGDDVTVSDEEDESVRMLSSSDEGDDGDDGSDEEDEAEIVENGLVVKPDEASDKEDDDENDQEAPVINYDDDEDEDDDFDQEGDGDGDGTEDDSTEDSDDDHSDDMDSDSEKSD